MNFIRNGVKKSRSIKMSIPITKEMRNIITKKNIIKGMMTRVRRAEKSLNEEIIELLKKYSEDSPYFGNYLKMLSELGLVRVNSSISSIALKVESLHVSLMNLLEKIEKKIEEM